MNKYGLKKTMQRYKVIIEYDGSNFCGWQRQENCVSVQQIFEEAIEKFCGEKITVLAAGRTDSGVHALGQVAHFDLKRKRKTDTVRDAINFHLKPALVSTISCEIVDDNFNSRFDAIERTYRYLITNRRSPLTLDHNHKWQVPVALDDKAMAKAAKVLIGKHDFTTFRAVKCQAKSPIKTLNVIDVQRQEENISIHVKARSFLHHQVRNIVGTLKLVGEGKWTADDVKAALDAKDRTAGGPTAPAKGLYLVEVKY